MLYKALVLFVVVFFDFCFSAKAQTAMTVPGLFDQYFVNFYLVNPAVYDPGYKYKGWIGDHSQTGLFQGVSRIYVDGAMKINNSEKTNYQYLGIQAVNSREGDYFSKSRLYARYSWGTRISAHASLTAGGSLGFVNYAFKASQASAGGSSAVPDGNVGMWYLGEQLKVGFSVQQMLNQKLKPINQSFRLKRFFNANMSYLFHLNPHLDLTAYLYSRLQPQETSSLDLASVFTIQQRLDAGVDYRYKKGIVFMAGLKKINIVSSQLSLYLSYMASTARVAVNDNALEIHISIQK